MGGRVDVTSEPDHRTTFTVQLPVPVEAGVERAGATS